MNAWAASLALHGLGVALVATLWLDSSDAAPATPMRWRVALAPAPVEPAAQADRASRLEPAPSIQTPTPAPAAPRNLLQRVAMDTAQPAPEPTATEPVAPFPDTPPAAPAQRLQASAEPVPAPVAVAPPAPVTPPVAEAREISVAPAPMRLTSPAGSAPSVGVSLATAEAAPASPRPLAPPLMEAASVAADKRWQSALLESLRALKRYPGIARRLGQEGVVLVEARISREGRIEAASVKRGSGYPILDNDALRLLESAAEAARERIRPEQPTRLEVPIAYRLAG